MAYAIFRKIMKLTFLIFLALCVTLFSQNPIIPEYYILDSNLNSELRNIVNRLELNKDFNVGEDGIEQISLAVIDLNGGKSQNWWSEYGKFHLSSIGL